MKVEGWFPNQVTFAAALIACAREINSMLPRFGSVPPMDHEAI